MALPPRIPRHVRRAPTRSRPGDSRQHLQWIKTLPCLVCGGPARDPHHLKRGVDHMPKGMGRTHEDRWAVPVCRPHHDWLEAGNDEEKLASIRIDGRSVARQLWANSGDTEAAERILFRARQAA
jgi:hypothetical protein